VVLSWLTLPQSNFKIFVTNRVAKIKELVSQAQWHYIMSKENPADCASRGLLPSQVLNHQLYWNGSVFLRLADNMWPSNSFPQIPESNLPELKSNRIEISLLTTVVDTELDFLKRFSSLNQMQRVITYIQRFKQRARKISSEVRPITLEERNSSLLVVIQITQRHYFTDLRRMLESPTHKISPRSITRLVPFIDDQGIIRAGGRVCNSDLTFEQKCPILLPKGCILIALLIRHYHLELKHAGCQTVAATIALKYWIISARSVIHHILFKCVICT